MTLQTHNSRLPLGIHSYTRLKEGGYRHVDKTASAHRILEEGSKWRLHLPEGWGKTLLLSTIEYLSRGEKPVIRLDLETEGGSAMRSEIERQLHDIEAVDDVYAGLTKDSIGRRLEILIRRRSKEWGCCAVLLIDNYDALLRHSGGRELLEEILRSLSRVDDSLHLLLLAGTGDVEFDSGAEFRDVSPSCCGFTMAEAGELMTSDSPITSADLEKRLILFAGTSEFLLSPFETVFLLSHPTGTPLPDTGGASTLSAGRIPVSEMRKALLDEKPEVFLRHVKWILASTPYQHFPIEKKEAFNHARIDLIVRMISDADIICHSEVQNSCGRLDMIIETPRTVYIFEFKHEKSAHIALEQIRSREYALPYRNSGKHIFAIGVNFAEDQRGISEWKILPVG